MLYHELWLMIAEQLETDQVSIMNLVMLSKATYRILLPALYTTVTLCDSKSISLFCESVSLPLGSQRSNLVKNLWVVPGYSTPSQQLVSIVPQVRLILMRLKNLERLALTSIPTASFGELFEGLECSFQLTHLTCACYPHDYFAGFLQQQTSITDLSLRSLARSHWGARLTVGFANHYNRRQASKLPFLPNLTSVTGNSVVLKLLCAGRPITSVVITELSPTRGDALAASIAQSTAPVRSLTVEVSTWH